MTTPGTAFDLDAPWRLHPQVAVRPERFGALLYHFGTRQLSFLKTPRLAAVVHGLAGESSARILTRTCRARCLLHDPAGRMNA